MDAVVCEDFVGNDVQELGCWTTDNGGARTCSHNWHEYVSGCSKGHGRATGRHLTINKMTNGYSLA
eukprot:12909493-Prorocentrum_lima.AAC.1